MARFALGTFVAIGLSFAVGWGLGYVSGFQGTAWGIGSVMVYLSFFAPPLMGVVSVLWIAYDSARRFRRCRASRTA